MDPAGARIPWQWDAGWMNAAWLRGVRDLLDWVLGDRPASPLCGRIVGLPMVYDLTYEDGAADDVVLQSHPAGLPVDPDTYPPPQYGEGLQETIRWLRGKTTTPPADQHGCGAYAPCPDSVPRCTCHSAGRCLRSDCETCATEPCLKGWEQITSEL
jgi:hypothetical protein